MNKVFETALQIALSAHSGQIDKQGNPYILHPLAVAAQLDNLDLKTVALLHDVIEDTETTAGELIEKGIPEYLVEVVVILTKPPKMSYEEYLQRIKADPMALAVKKADLAHNTSPSRSSGLNKRRIAKYELAKKILYG
ncbi:MAG: HD domain-containing protein [Candidatus Saccharibacteria bacterium]|nr:HD domain-containing protein [Candidatus Saccharibacteria bacterium]